MRAGVAAQPLQQQALLEAVVEDQVDRRRGSPSASGAASSTMAPGSSARSSAENSSSSCSVVSGGPSVRWTMLRRRSGVSSLLAGDDERAEHVDAVLQVVVLRVDVDAHQVGVVAGVGSRAASRSPCWGYSEGA